MEYLWSMYGVSTEEKRPNSGVSCMEYPLFLWSKIKNENKIPHRQGIHEELMEVWEMRELLNKKRIIFRELLLVFSLNISLSI